MSSLYPSIIKVEYGVYANATLSTPNFFFEIQNEEDRKQAASVFIAMLAINSEARDMRQVGEYIRLTEVDGFVENGKAIRLAGYGMNRHLSVDELDRLKRLCNGRVLTSVEWFPDKFSRSSFDGRPMKGALIATILTEAYLNDEIKSSSSSHFSHSPSSSTPYLLPPIQTFTHSRSSPSSSLPSSSFDSDPLNRRISHLLQSSSSSSSSLHQPSLFSDSSNNISRDSKQHFKKHLNVMDRGINKHSSFSSSSSPSSSLSSSSLAKLLSNNSPSHLLTSSTLTASSPTTLLKEKKKKEKKIFEEAKKDFLKQRSFFTWIFDAVTGVPDSLSSTSSSSSFFEKEEKEEKEKEKKKK